MAVYTDNMIPTMTSYTTPSGVVSASSEYGGFPAWMAFDKIYDISNAWITSNGTITGWLAYDFGTIKTIGKYTIRPRMNDTYGIVESPKNWTFEGWSGSQWVVLDTQTNISTWQAGIVKEFIITNPQSFSKYRINITANNGNASFTGIGEMEMFGLKPNKTLISLTGGEYKYWENASSEVYSSFIPALTSNTAPSGIASASSIYSTTYDAWTAFDKNTTSGQGWITLSGTTIGWIQYKFVNPRKITRYEITSSNVIGSSPKNFTFEGSNDGSNYTVLDTKTSQTWTGFEKRTFNIVNENSYLYYRINISLNNGESLYTGLLELDMYEFTSPAKTEGWQTATSLPPTKADFDTYGMEDLSTIPESAWQSLSSTSPNVQLVTYVPTGNTASNFTESYDALEKKINMTALPKGQIVVDNKDLDLYGSLTNVLVNRLNDGLPSGVIRFLLSFDKGLTWKTLENDVWTQIDVSLQNDFISRGLTISELLLIPESKFTEKIDSADKTIRFAYYIEENIRDIDSSKINNIAFTQKTVLNTPEINNMSLYVLNTISTIDMALHGKDLNGTISDIDSGKVKYKVTLNGQPYYPQDGSFTSYESTPLNINLKIDSNSVLIDQQNTVRVDFEDYWGVSDFWEVPFIGTYNGLIFKDPIGAYYANDIGQILKYLDIGTLIAGQVSSEFEIHLQNTYGYDVQNATITSNTQASGVIIELSKVTNPFVAQSQLVWSEVADGDEKVFYMRLVTNYTTPPVMGGLFELKVNADQI